MVRQAHHGEQKHHPELVEGGALHPDIYKQPGLEARNSFRLSENRDKIRFI
jgi:hypothetical protein